MSIKTRIEKLETMRDAEDEVTLPELIRYSYRGPDDRDLAFERRAARSSLCKLIAATTDAGNGFNRTTGPKDMPRTNGSASSRVIPPE
jgi:hypothetical protein